MLPPVVVAVDPADAAALALAAESAGLPAEVVGLADVRRHLDAEEPRAILLYVGSDLALSHAGLRAVTDHRFAPGATDRLLLVGSASTLDAIEPLVRERRAIWTVAPSIATLDTADLAALLGEASGSSTLARRAPSRCALHVRASSERHAAVEAARAFAGECGAGASAVSRLGAAVEELLSNALYHAPVDRHGGRRFAAVERTQPVALAPGEVIEIELASDGARIGAVVRDPFGSLDHGAFFDALARGFGGRGDGRSRDSTGAGLGLSYTLGLVEGLRVEVHPGRTSEVSTHVRSRSRGFRKSLCVRIGGGANRC